MEIEEFQYFKILNYSPVILLQFASFCIVTNHMGELSYYLDGTAFQFVLFASLGIL